MGRIFMRTVPRRLCVLETLCLGLLIALLGASGAARGADRDEDGFDDLIDVCPFAFDDQSDVGGIGIGSAPDGIGDACQCGDVDDDGIVTPADADLLSRAALGLDPIYSIVTLPGFDKCDVGGTEGCSGLDGSIVTRATLDPAPAAPMIQQVCPSAVFTPTNNLALQSNPISLVGLTELVVGHTNVLQLRLRAAEPTENVAIQFFIVNKAEADAAGENDEVQQFLVGSTLLETLNAGETVVDVQVDIPADDLDGNAIAAGEYYLYPVLDPGQELPETDEGDNLPPQSDFAVVTVTDAFLDAESVVIEDLVLDFSSFELPRVLSGLPDPDESCPGGVAGPRSGFDDPSDAVLNALNSDVSVTALVRRTAGVSNAFQAFRMAPTLFHPRLVGSALCPTGACPVEVWAGSGYQSFLPPSGLGATDENPTSVHVDVRVPATPEYRDLFNALLNGIQSDCEAVCAPGDALCVSACTLSELALGSVRVEIVPPPGGTVFGNPFIELSNTQPITILPPRFVPAPTPMSPLRFEEGFDAGFSAKFAGAGVRANAWGALDGTGASAYVGGAVPITLFGQEFEFLGIDAGGAAFPGSVGEGFALDLRFAGLVVYSQLLNDDTCALDLTDRTDLTVTGALLDWKLDLFVEKSKGFERDFVVGLVPLTAGFEASGKLGFLVETAVPVCSPVTPTMFQAQAGPYLDVGMLASAGVGTSKGFSAGIEGQATLIEDTFYSRAQATNLDLDTFSSPARVEGTLSEDIVNTLVGPSGGINLYVGYPCIKWCRWFGIPYPCAISQCRARQSIFRFSSFLKEDVLMCEAASTSVEVP